MILQKLIDAEKYIKSITDFKPDIAVVLGSGLGVFAECIEKVCEISYKDIPGFPVSTVKMHDGKYIFGNVCGKKVVAMCGRVHYYEGYDIEDVVMPIRVMKLLGADKLILTNASGGIGDGFKAGDIMMITDQISSLMPSVLRGKNIDEFGVRFPDMSEIYSKSMRETLRCASENTGLELKEGVYIQTQGPNYESPAEIRAYKKWGADAVGMSTAVEAIAARHMGMEICGISCISNLAAGISKNPLTHEEVVETSNRVSGEFKTLLKEFIKIL